jgi:hypothetical protein
VVGVGSKKKEGNDARKGPMMGQPTPTNGVAKDAGQDVIIVVRRASGWSRGLAEELTSRMHSMGRRNTSRRGSVLQFAVRNTEALHRGSNALALWGDRRIVAWVVLVPGGERGRSARATGRREQFNPRVHRNFLEGFRQALKDESARTGKSVSQGYMLEMMLAAWRHERAAGGSVKGLGLMLPEMTMRAASDLAKHLDLSVEAAVSDAITERMISSGLAKVKPGTAVRREG